MPSAGEAGITTVPVANVAAGAKIVVGDVSVYENPVVGV